MKRSVALILTILFSVQASGLFAQDSVVTEKPREFDAKNFSALKFRNIGPFRGGRSNTVAGVLGDPMTYFFGGTGGGVWKTSDAGITWKNVSDGFFKSGSVGTIAIAPSDQNVIYVGMGEHAVRGVMTSHGDGMYKSTDAGKTWKPIGLTQTRHIGSICIHPSNPDIAYVAAQGSAYAASNDRGIYKTTDGGASWKHVLFVNETTAASDLSMDANNPRILYAGMWDNQRRPWKIRSGGPGSGIHKSTDGGLTWAKLSGGLPDAMGKVAVDVSPANSNVVYANIEAEKGGVFRSNDAGTTWKQTNSDRTTVARAWYYIEIFADPIDENRVYVLNAPMLKSIDGGKSFSGISNPHGDQHDLWINPANPKNIILGNDGGACVTFNGGVSWSTQRNQPTAQFYRVITDNQFPYRVYGGQQDNSTVSIASRSSGGNISERDWFATAGGESAFLAFDPNDPQVVYGTSIQGMINRHHVRSNLSKSIEIYPEVKLGKLPKDQKHRFNWNGPLTFQPQNPNVMYHGGNVLFRTDDRGHSWTEISKDLTRNDSSKHGAGSEPYTDEAAGGEVYNTISYIAACPHNAGTVWVGTDDGLVQRTPDDGKTWENVTPEGLDESLINAIGLSPHDPATAFIAATRYKYDDLSPVIYKTTNHGKNWTAINRGIDPEHFVRVVRQDPINPKILYAGTEGGLYISLNTGLNWHRFQLNLPVCPITDLTFQDNDLIIATSGRAFWILDDLGAIQQSGGNLKEKSFAIFNPKPSYKFTSAGSAGPSSMNGQNPLPGVIFDYQLPTDWKKETELKLEILDSEGSTVRTMSSIKPEGLETWPGGPTPPSVIPANPGLNRYHWNLKTNPIAGVKQVMVFGSHDGPRVVPGTYTLRLIYDDKTTETQTVVMADPRVSGTSEDYALQSSMLKTIRSTANDVHVTVNQLRRVKSQLEGRLELLREMPSHADLVAVGDKTLKEIEEWESKLIQPKQKTFQDVINFPNKFNAELINLGGQVDTNEPRPTAAAQALLKELVTKWTSYKSDLDKLANGSIAEFNSQYKAKALPILIIPGSSK